MYLIVNGLHLSLNLIIFYILYFFRLGSSIAQKAFAAVERLRKYLLCDFFCMYLCVPFF